MTKVPIQACQGGLVSDQVKEDWAREIRRHMDLHADREPEDQGRAL